MSQTYKATGINLKGMPFGETDRLLTVLTPEFGLVSAIAPGARKPKSRLRGRTELFVVNDLLIVKGKSLDKIIQAETQESYPGLSKNLGKLTASQYLAEVVLCIALREQTQAELYTILTEHLSRIADSSNSITEILAYLCHALFHLLAIAGVAPQVYNCCLTQQPLRPNFHQDNWQASFSFEAGGVIDFASYQQSLQGQKSVDQLTAKLIHKPKVNFQLKATELLVLQKLSAPTLDLYTREIKEKNNYINDLVWIRVEQMLRNYFQFQFNKLIRSATLFASLLET